MVVRTCTLSLTLALLLPALPHAADAGALPDAPDPDWRFGPVRYILLVKEDQEYKALETDARRAEFIEAFWAALDPTPGTAVNERRVEFWKRVEAADREFQEGLAPGWKSDRGKVYILVGPPDERQQKGPSEIWWYQVLPEAGADPRTMFRFGRNSEGKFRMGRQEFMGRGALTYWDPTAGGEGPAAGETFLAVRSEDGTPQMMKGRFRMVDYPLAEVKTEFATAPLEGSLRLDFYRVKRSTTRVVVTLAVSQDQFQVAGAQLQPPQVTLSVSVDEVKKGKSVGSYSTPMEPAGGSAPGTDRPLVFQGAFTIEPGTYRAILTIVDARSHRGLTRSETLEAPDFGGDLALSSIAIGRLREEPTATEGAGSAGAPLVPEPVGAFHPGETVLFAYEVYNADRKGGARTDLDVTYEFFIDTEQGPRQAAKPVILHHQASGSLAYSLSLRGWPEASFLVRIRVTDNRTRKSVEGEGRFRIERP